VTYSVIKIGTYQLPYNNPGENSNPPVQSVSRAPALGGTIFTTYPEYQSDRTVILSWDAMEKSMYDEIESVRSVAGGAPIPYIDEFGQHWTVKFVLLNYKTVVGTDIYAAIQATLWVLSKD